MVGGSGTAVWEVVRSGEGDLGTLEFQVFVSYQAPLIPPPGTATVHGSFGPISTVTTASATAFIPRFVDTSSGKNLFTVDTRTL